MQLNALKLPNCSIGCLIGKSNMATKIATKTDTKIATQMDFKINKRLKLLFYDRYFNTISGKI